MVIHVILVPSPKLSVITEFGIVISAIMISVKSVLIDIGICISLFFTYEISYF